MLDREPLKRHPSAGRKPQNAAVGGLSGRSCTSEACLMRRADP